LQRNHPVPLSPPKDDRPIKRRDAPCSPAHPYLSHMHHRRGDSAPSVLVRRHYPTQPSVAHLPPIKETPEDRTPPTVETAACSNEPQGMQVRRHHDSARRLRSDEHADDPVVDRPDDADSGPVQPRGRQPAFNVRLGLGHELASRLEVRRRARRGRGDADVRLVSGPAPGARAPPVPAVGAGPRRQLAAVPVRARRLALLCDLEANIAYIAERSRSSTPVSAVGA
jgi:hypothetical protein